MTGKIIKGIAGFYYVNNGENKVYQCKAKGIFRNRKIKPLVCLLYTSSEYDHMESLDAFQKGWIQVQDISSDKASIESKPSTCSALDVYKRQGLISRWMMCCS